jgi:hypothetical protein
MPLGKFTPAIAQAKMNAKALSLRDAMADCILSDTAIHLITLRLNTGRSIAQLARALKIEPTNAYVMMRSPQAQQLMAELAHSMLGIAAVDAVSTMQRIMRSKDHSLAYRAAETMMERAGLGLSQRTQPDGATKTVFAFAFGAPQAETQAARVAPVDKMGPIGSPEPEAGALKTGTVGSGEATTPVILEPGAGGRRALPPVILEPGTALLPSRPQRPRTVKRS